MIFSTSAIYAWERHGDQYYFLKRQLMWIGLGLIAMITAAVIKLDFLEKNSKFILLFTGVLLVLVLMPSIGSRVGGARRWLKLGGWSVQPAELAKLALIIYAARFLSRNRELADDFTNGVMPLLMVVGSVVGLIILQPDLGTSVLISAIVFLMMYLGGVKLKYMLGILSAAVPALVALIMVAPYRLKRIFVFFDPWQDPDDAGYQIVQSFLALGSGGFRGRGLGASVQKLYYLPESFTDFIFSIIGEEAGFIGTSAVLLLLAALVWCGFKISVKTDDKFERLLCSGVVLMIALQSIIHIGVVTGSLPTKGLPLPFISFGGSSLMVHMFGAGLLMNVAKHSRRAAQAERG